MKVLQAARLLTIALAEVPEVEKKLDKTFK
jgi:hypothetical protein